MPNDKDASRQPSAKPMGLNFHPSLLGANSADEYTADRQMRRALETVDTPRAVKNFFKTILSKGHSDLKGQADRLKLFAQGTAELSDMGNLLNLCGSWSEDRQNIKKQRSAYRALRKFFSPLQIELLIITASELPKSCQYKLDMRRRTRHELRATTRAMRNDDNKRLRVVAVTSFILSHYTRVDLDHPKKMAMSKIQDGGVAFPSIGDRPENLQAITPETAEADYKRGRAIIQENGSLFAGLGEHQIVMLQTMLIRDFDRAETHKIAPFRPKGTKR
ncbi:MAG: hypothetical protein RLN87_03185 [Parasphingopyxis sp.]|uniref:hypothetical protein n=1 Tax=Parasphingopyxis sp. TaxID=1920299 RepID=UPI0032EE1EEA